MAYNNMVCLSPVKFIWGLFMRNCIGCYVSFISLSFDQYCSIKCKILQGIEKKENGCWIYKGSSSGVYSKIRWDKKWHSAHRSSYTEFIGNVPIGKWVCHKCDVPKCINPDHLFIGSPSDNRRDAVSKKRVTMGIDNHFSRFTDIQVSEIRRLNSEGVSYERLSGIFNCSFVYIYKIIKNKIRKV